MMWWCWDDSTCVLGCRRVGLARPLHAGEATDYGSSTFFLSLLTAASSMTPLERITLPSSKFLANTLSSYFTTWLSREQQSTPRLWQPKELLRGRLRTSPSACSADITASHKPIYLRRTELLFHIFELGTDYCPCFKVIEKCLAATKDNE